VIVAAVLAWKSVQRQIQSAENIESARSIHELDTLKVGFTAELFVYSRGIIEAASTWNQRLRTAPNQPVRTDWPVLQDPLFYRANLPKIGLVPHRWVALAIIGFYTNVLELDDPSRESLAGRPTVNITSERIAARLHIMASNLSQALDGLNDDRKFPIAPDIDLEQVFMPDGRPVSRAENLPGNLQDLLLRLAGIARTPPT